MSSNSPLVLLRWPGGIAAQRQHLGSSPSSSAHSLCIRSHCRLLQPARQLFSFPCLDTDPRLAAETLDQLEMLPLSHSCSHGKARFCSSKLAQQDIILAVLSCKPGPNLTPQEHGQVGTLS